ncbi:MAG: phycobilisome rod-core linker polypeptide [Cyanobacteria bacterium P01_D01_bin.73]
MSLWIESTDPVELRPNFTEDDLQGVIRAVYRQVLGNEHLMESDRLESAESFLRNGDVTVRQFVSMVGNSDLYRRLFFESSSQYRFIELNMKHFLGRAPRDQAEISAHVAIYKEGGYEAEIASYVYSDEYAASFGENVVPYIRTSVSQTGYKNVDFNRVFAISRGNSASDGDGSSKLVGDLAANLPTKITAASSSIGRVANTAKRFRITVTRSGVTPVSRRSNQSYEVDYSQLSKRVQTLTRSGAKILSVTEV